MQLLQWLHSFGQYWGGVSKPVQSHVLWLYSLSLVCRACNAGLTAANSCRLCNRSLLQLHDFAALHESTYLALSQLVHQRSCPWSIEISGDNDRRPLLYSLRVYGLHLEGSQGNNVHHISCDNTFKIGNIWGAFREHESVSMLAKGAIPDLKRCFQNLDACTREQVYLPLQAVNAMFQHVILSAGQQLYTRQSQGGAAAALDLSQTTGLLSLTDAPTLATELQAVNATADAAEVSGGKLCQAGGPSAQPTAAINFRRLLQQKPRPAEGMSQRHLLLDAQATVKDVGLSCAAISAVLLLSCAALGSAVLCCAMLCCAGLGWAGLGCAELCWAVLCSAALCCAVLCCAVLCCAGLRCTRLGLAELFVHCVRCLTCHGRLCQPCCATSGFHKHAADHAWQCSCAACRTVNCDGCRREKQRQ